MKQLEAKETGMEGGRSVCRPPSISYTVPVQYAGNAPVKL
jgi:hypothetical protein